MMRPPRFFQNTRRRFGLHARVLLALAMLGAAIPAARAVDPNERLANPALEARARAISVNLRCLVCQNETIDESNAGLAHDLRVFLRQRLLAGDTDSQAVQAIVDRYGNFVLLKPPVMPATYILWFAPFGLALCGAAGLVVWLRRRAATPDADATLAAKPLNASEQDRLETLLQESDH
jgi:cytochrome c-type biogenesis protein CcmH